MSEESTGLEGGGSPLRRQVVISADCHAGASVHGYRPYLDRKWRADFDEWARCFHDPWVEKASDLPTSRRSGVSASALEVNWDSDRRLRELDADGIAAEILFPNTAPPFFPSGVITAPAPKTRMEYERRWAGVQAHNRWLVDFVAQAPGRRAGVAQVYLNDVPEAVREIRRAKDDNLSAILLPLIDPDSGLPPIYADDYEPIWQVAEELDLPVHHHSVAPSSSIESPTASMVGIVETMYWAHRCLWHVILGGVFERHPNVRYVLTEANCGWIPERMNQLDNIWKWCRAPGTSGSVRAGEAAAKLPLKPSEYFARNCYVGASFLLPQETPTLDHIGVDRIMWGSDYPHAEGTYPFSAQAIRASLATMPTEVIDKVVTTTAAALYGFDQTFLEGVAASIGPLASELRTPLAADDAPRVPADTNCSVFSKRPSSLL